ncbi:hypothetical protein KTE91_03360 [Burkholderia multivorans]|uniref:hypothetical protein n=1 Tax=Burkholderia multivorans TaxID=87883 RepID=UPI001C219F22|nr:hypothetical protein [Burkholderia multivorans]MBU9434120.1 hypothetical protein [Burkholderia multivorans]
MESVVEYIEKIERKDLEAELRSNLEGVLDMLPEESGDLLLHNLSLLPEDKRAKLISLVQKEGVINNKAVLVSILGMIVSAKTIADTIEAVAVAENMLKEAIPGMTKDLLGEFGETLTDYLAYCLNELSSSKSEIASESLKLREALGSFHQAMADAATGLEQGYKERSQHLSNLSELKIKEMDNAFNKKLLEVQKVMSEHAAKELRKAIVPVVLKAIGWRGLVSMVGVVVVGMLIHDLIAKYVFH